MSWERHAREELAPKMASSAYVITVNPDDIDPKVALETGYAILLGKPILLLVPPGGRPNAGLERIATQVVRLRSDLGTDDAQQQLQAALVTMPGGAT